MSSSRRFSIKSLTFQKKRTSVTPALREQVTVKLQRFYTVHDPQQLEEGIDAVVDYALITGLDSLDSELVSKYGDTLEGTANSFRDASYNNLTGQGGSSDKVRRRLELFFAKYEPEKLARPIDTEAVVEWTLYNGYGALNERLKRTYGATLDDVSKADIHSILEAFYDGNEPQKPKADIATIAEWMWANGAEVLNEKMVMKYGVGLTSAKMKLQMDYYTMLCEKFYRVYEPSKLQDKAAVNKVVDWAVRHGLDKLNLKLRAKYNGNDLAEFMEDVNVQSTPLMLSMTLERKFNQTTATAFALDDSPIHEDEEDEAFHGDEEKASKEVSYLGINDSSSSSEPDSSAASGPHCLQEAEAASSKRTSGGKSRKSSAAKVTQSADSSAAATSGRSIVRPAMGRDGSRSRISQIVADRKPEARKRLLQLLETFYSKHDPERLMDEGITAILDWTLYHGVDKLNAKMRKKYKEDLNTIEDLFDTLSRRVITFYKYYDPERVRGMIRRPVTGENNAAKFDDENEDEELSEEEIARTAASVEALVKWTIINGPKALNDRLIAKYEDDLNGRGLKVKLMRYYSIHDPGKTEQDVSELAEWVAENGIELLDARLKEKYGKGLADPIEDKVSISKASGVRQQALQSTLTRSRAGSNALPDMEQNPDFIEALGRQLESFFVTYDPAELSNSNALARHINWILRHGIEAFNETMLEKYGHNLKAMGSRRAFSMSRHDSASTYRRLSRARTLPPPEGEFSTDEVKEEEANEPDSEVPASNVTDSSTTKKSATSTTKKASSKKKDRKTSKTRKPKPRSSKTKSHLKSRKTSIGSESEKSGTKKTSRSRGGLFGISHNRKSATPEPEELGDKPRVRF